MTLRIPLSSPEDMIAAGLKGYNPEKDNDFHIFYKCPLKEFEVYESSLVEQYAKYYKIKYKLLTE